MNKRKLEKSQRDNKFKRRRPSRILEKKFFDWLDNPTKIIDLPARLRNLVIEWFKPIITYEKVMKQLHQYFAAKIIQKNFREYMVKKNNYFLRG